MNAVSQLVQSPLGAFVFLTVAAVLESYGDSCFQAAMYHSTGTASAGAAIVGAIVLAAYGVMVNLPRWDFGRLIGIYVAVFFHISAGNQPRAIRACANATDICRRGADRNGWTGDDLLEVVKHAAPRSGMVRAR
jgi:hypothetical protein